MLGSNRIDSESVRDFDSACRLLRRPNAQALPKETSRRTVLAAVLAAGATAPLPAVATAGVACSHHPDADLFALIERARTADSLVDEAMTAADDILDKMTPSRPQALVWTEADAPHWYWVRPRENPFQTVHRLSEDVDPARQEAGSDEIRDTG